MKFLRNIAYGIIAVCAILCVVILTYSGKNNDTDTESTVAIDTTESIEVVVENGEVDIEDLKDAASLIISNAKDNVMEAVSYVSASIAKENNTGEIAYSEIVRLQEEAVALQQKLDVAESNAAHGIVASTPSSTSKPENVTSTSDVNFLYVVNTSTGKIHRMGCLLEPTGKYAKYFETFANVTSAGYTEKCTVCSP